MNIDTIITLETSHLIPIEFKVGEAILGIWLSPELSTEEIEQKVREYTKQWQRSTRKFNYKWNGIYTTLDKATVIKQLKDQSLKELLIN